MKKLNYWNHGVNTIAQSKKEICVMSTSYMKWTQARGELNWEKASPKLSLVIDVGGPTPLQVVPPLGTWCWAV